MYDVCWCASSFTVRLCRDEAQKRDIKPFSTHNKNTFNKLNEERAKPYKRERKREMMAKGSGEQNNQRIQHDELLASHVLDWKDTLKSLVRRIASKQQMYESREHIGYGYNPSVGLYVVHIDTNVCSVCSSIVSLVFGTLWEKKLRIFFRYVQMCASFLTGGRKNSRKNQRSVGFAIARLVLSRWRRDNWIRKKTRFNSFTLLWFLMQKKFNRVYDANSKWNDNSPLFAVGAAYTKFSK